MRNYTTGATIISDLDGSPKSISGEQLCNGWGIGIVVMAITILPLLKVEECNYLKWRPDSAEKFYLELLRLKIISTYLMLTFCVAYSIDFWYVSIR